MYTQTVHLCLWGDWAGFSNIPAMRTRETLRGIKLRLSAWWAHTSWLPCHPSTNLKPFLIAVHFKMTPNWIVCLKLYDLHYFKLKEFSLDNWVIHFTLQRPTVSNILSLNGPYVPVYRLFLQHHITTDMYVEVSCQSSDTNKLPLTHYHLITMAIHFFD